MTYAIRGFLSSQLIGALTISLLFAAGVAAAVAGNDNEHWVGTWSASLHEPDLGVPGLANAGYKAMAIDLKLFKND